ncbi:MAG: translation initiation factor IF-2 [Candidatus Omnitrophota bacterium]
MVKEKKVKITKQKEKEKKIKKPSAKPAAARKAAKKAVVKVVAKPKKITAAKHKPVARIREKIHPVVIAPPAVSEKPVEKIAVPKIIPPKAQPPVAKPVVPVIKEQAAPAQETKKEIPLPKAQPPKQEPVPVTAQPVAPAPELKEIELELPITLKDLAVKLQEKPSVLIKYLMDSGTMAGINHPLPEAAAAKICEKYKYKIKKAPDAEELILRLHEEKDLAQDLVPRPPIVTFMGHVDHGKTSLLDAIRKTKVAESEHGGITQHIGAYRVLLPAGEITFLDTPGHEAFTAMRSRGAKVTDIVVLVVAADDGIMPQTEEAIDHARAAGVPIIVAVNKIDKPQADLDRVKKQLGEHDLLAEDWGGKTITAPVSAKTGQGIDNLLEMILLEAQMLELKCNPKRLARGIVIEAKMAKGRGPVATLLVQNGTLHLNENIVVGNYYGKVRAMFNDRGLAVTSAAFAVPVEVLGISDVPEAGEQFLAIADEKQAKELAQARMEKDLEKQIKSIKRVSLEDLHAQIEAGKIKDLKLILKADTQGSLGAIKDTLDKLNVSEIKVEVIHGGVGSINTSDVVLAVASDALIVGFNVSADTLAKEMIAKEGIDFRNYNIIYELANDIKLAVEGMLAPRLKKVFLGKAEIRKVFNLSHSGIVAGCFVTKGKFNRSALINLVRNGEIIFEGKLSALKRFKDDVREVQEGFECGMSLAGFTQYVEGDVIEAYEIESIARKL